MRVERKSRYSNLLVNNFRVGRRLLKEGVEKVASIACWRRQVPTMAEGGASSSIPAAVILTEEEELNGAAAGWVEARTSCDHVSSIPSDYSHHMPDPTALCSRCESAEENWLCLVCKDVLCSRFINKHMLIHYQDSGHCLALSYSDLSVWCFECEAYLDAQAILELQPVYEVAYLMKFGERPPLRCT